MCFVLCALYSASGWWFWVSWGCEAQIFGWVDGIQAPGLGMSMGAGPHCVMRFSVRARCWRAKLQRFQSHLKKCSVSGTDRVMVQAWGISFDFWIHTAQTLELCALYYTKVTSTSFSKAWCLSVSLYRLLFRESNDRKTNCSVMSETRSHSLYVLLVFALCFLYFLFCTSDLSPSLPILLILLFLIFLYY